MRSLLPFMVRGQELLENISDAFSTLSTPPRPAEWGWVSQFAAPSLICTEAISGRKCASAWASRRLEAAGTFAAEPPNYPNGCHMCEVEIDPETGLVTLVRYASAADVGKIMNPLLCESADSRRCCPGRWTGVNGVAIVFDANGQLVNGSFQNSTPRAADFPDLMVELREVPATTNPVGVKGAGEAGATGAPPAVISAILDALRPLGIDHIDMPASRTASGRRSTRWPRSATTERRH